MPDGSMAGQLSNRELRVCGARLCEGVNWCAWMCIGWNRDWSGYQKIGESFEILLSFDIVGNKTK